MTGSFTKKVVFRSQVMRPWFYRTSRTQEEMPKESFQKNFE